MCKTKSRATAAMFLSLLSLGACTTIAVVPAPTPVAEMETPAELAAEARSESAACASRADMQALEVAVIQQKLMVAGYMCQASGAYNNFVDAYRSDLLASDFMLQNFFHRLHGQEGNRAYDSFKTRLANLSMRESAANLDTYCVNLNAVFDRVVEAPDMSLETFVSRAEVESVASVHTCDLIAYR